MISVLPAKTTEQQAALLQNHDIRPGYTCLYRAEEKGKEIGWFSLCADNDRVTVLQMEVNACKSEQAMTEDDKYLAELLIRTAASYALNHMIECVQYNGTQFRDFLRPFGFTEDEQGGFCIDVNKLIHVCGHCGHKD